MQKLFLVRIAENLLLKDNCIAVRAMHGLVKNPCGSPKGDYKPLIINSSENPSLLERYKKVKAQFCGFDDGITGILSYQKLNTI